MLLTALKFLAAFDQTEPGADTHHKYLDWVTRPESNNCISFCIHSILYRNETSFVRPGT